MKRILSVGLAGMTALSLAAAPAQAAEGPNNLVEGGRQFVEIAKLNGIVADKGYGAAPETDGAKDMMTGSVEQGSTAEQAWQGTQAGWALTWIAVAAAGLGAIGFVANQAGLLNLPF
ncbi:hypothetical protein [Corynebacterium sp. p3-SID1056]|uniref:hypothetical protein n=1 Tax=Corynebacterium sp. p3-SID1056 TaxID=2916092 RepID=UPI0021A3C85F|nr:hypothetical protein [Corynebacterium sp. p3-SID1056]MCT2338194.1 hypothetical protein [Corynebacterium sp. p3-SID1056]